MKSDKNKRIGVITLVLLAAAFVAAVMASNALLRGVRIDLTENQLYTLSEGTRSLLANIDEPINLYYFFSDRAVDDDQQFLRAFATRVREMLEEFATNADGKIVLHVIDPLPFSEDEDRAGQLGLQPVSLGGIDDSVYFGLAGTNSVGDEDIIAFFQPSKENFLEYDVAKLVYNLAKPNKTVIGVMAGVPLSGGFDARSQQPTRPWVAYEQAEQLFEVREFEPSTPKIPDDVDVLWVVHPAMIEPAALYAIDQFVMRGGRALIFVDPLAEVAAGAPSPMGFNADNGSTLEPLLANWGIEFDPGQVVADEALALSINTGTGRPTRHIGLLGLDASAIDQDDVITGGLQSINVGVAGRLSLAEGSALTFVPLLQSSTEAALLPTSRFQFLQDPNALFDGFTPTGERYTIAAKLSGPLTSAYPDGPPEEAGDAAGEPHIGSIADANIVVVADVDVLSNRLWVQEQSFLGQRLTTAFASNGDFLINALDNLSGSSELIGLRSRASFSRPFEKVDALRMAADAQFRSTEERLQAELADTERRLGELQSQREDTSSLLMSAEQQQELQRFLDQQVRIRQELRQVRSELDKDIERLGNTLRLVNIGLVPLLLVAFVLLRVLWSRSRRGSAS
jgi:ABC-type uncharacterized transport system involved in gliding motility auxiliary subunit